LQEGETSSSIAVYPNPVKDRFTLSLNNDYEGLVKVEIINMNGAVQKTFTVNKQKGKSQTSVWIGDLPKGSYIIKAAAKGWNQIKQIIKQ